MLFSLQSSSFQSSPRLPSSTRPLVIPLQSTLICMEYYSVFPNLGIHFKPTLPLVGKIWKKTQLIATPNDYGPKKFHRDPTKIGFFGSPRKKAKRHKILSLSRARFQTLGRCCMSAMFVGYFGCLYWLKVFFPNTKWILRISVFFLCVSVNCYVSCLVCVAICVSRSYSLYFFKNVFPCFLLFLRPNPQRIGPREEKGEKESLKKGGTHTFLRLIFLIDW
jgi:hypothetical protein